MWKECGPCPVFASFTLAFALQLRKKHGKTSVRVRKTLVTLRKTSARIQYTYYQNTHTLQNPHKHTYPHITEQYKTTTVQIKTNTVQDIPKWNSHNIIKCPQYKVTLMYIEPLTANNVRIKVAHYFQTYARAVPWQMYKIWAVDYIKWKKKWVLWISISCFQYITATLTKSVFKISPSASNSSWRQIQTTPHSFFVSFLSV